MSSSSSLTSIVNLDAETAIKLSQFIASLGSGAPDAAFADACKSLIENAQTEALVTKFLTKQDAFFALESDSDIEGIFQAIVSIAFTLGDASVVPAVIKQLISALTASTDSRQTIRLRVLASLFNLATADQSKFDLMSAILKYALASGQAKEVAHFHNRVEGWVSSWNLKPAEKQGIYSDTIQVLEASGQSSMAMRYKIKYLESFAGEPFSDKALPVAIDTVVRAIKSPIANFSDRSAILDCISAKQATGALGTLIQLLNIICTGSLDTYTAWAPANAALLKEHGVSVEEVGNSMRMLQLCTLAVAADQKEIPYSTIAKALQVAEADVESWVVDSIAQGLLEASMDQFKQCITVTRCVQRSFGPEQWKALQQKLSGLRKNVAGILETIKKNDAQA